LLYVGDVTWNKNLPRLIDAVKELKVPLVMIGKSLVSEDYDRDNPWNADLNRVNELAKNDKNIIRLGFVPDLDLVSVYNLATAAIMPSLYEGFGLPVLEAMACGCPVITSKEGSLGEVAGDSAFFVDAYDVKSISSGIKEVFGNKDLQEALRKKGLENVKKFNWKKTAEETVRAYEGVLGK
jgi:glycosyltransferase involved in cell wall biosynthesis